MIKELNNSNIKVIAVVTDNQQYEEYKRYFTIAAPGKTRWNSCYYVCTSILKTQKALQFKLRAEITYNHRQKTDIPLATIQTILAEVELSNYEESLQKESMLEDEKKAFKELEEIDDDENDNITHPAINLDAK
ncbi:hypothetical protein Glove_235g31 [Diversispora epigaea]|uniref:Uncharacterized protein n=1 Tax=Diversispora epigaea TaxID=1348612 RepID=A0A397IAZ5_9GLOM|nr:hypothetical protein Glove_235g31 [Diversispora epigaea]